MRAMAVFLTETPKLVFSKTLKDVTWKNSRVVPELDPRKIEAMKKRPGKDMLIFGSGSIVSQLTQHGLIDEYQFVVSPILLGSGRQLFGNLAKSSKLVHGGQAFAQFGERRQFNLGVQLHSRCHRDGPHDPCR